MSNAGAQSFRKLANTMLIIARIIFWLSCGAAAILVLASAVIAFIPSGAFPAIAVQDAIHFDFAIPFEANVVLPAGTSYKAVLLTFFLGIAPFCAWTGFFFLHVRRILDSVAKGSPFDPHSSRSLKRLAACVALYPFAGWACGGFLLTVFKSFSIPLPSLRFGYDFTALIFAGLLCVLSGIFKYGAELQCDVDATV